MTIRKYRESDIPEMMRIWNETVSEGIHFPQEEGLLPEEAKAFFSEQSYCGVAEEDGKLFGIYILHPNNVGRCGHISNASFAVDSTARGRKIGEKLVLDCLLQAKKAGFGILQFNAVVATNTVARHLYEKLGFICLGRIKNGFRLSDGSYLDICPYYKEL